ncbi:MAG: aldo/keto reductase [Lachnospiraceae bacterium]|nr:aldo/keto reductase [Lachnospiraceae bacterium]
MKQITLGKTGIKTPQNAFGALPIQRRDKEQAVRLLRLALDGGMTYFDTARAYSDSEEKIGAAFGGSSAREEFYIATKTASKTPEGIQNDLDTSLKLLQTDYIDIYQLHMATQCYREGDGTGVYECLLEAKRQGKIRHIAVTAHMLGVARECVESGLYETLQFPFSYLSGEQELELVDLCRTHNVGFIAMKGMAGGLITRSEAAMAFMDQFDNVLPIWGIQHESELNEWLSYIKETPAMTDDLRSFIEKEQDELAGEFCRGCGYCMPCPMGILINNCARMSLLLRRAPSKAWLSEYWQGEMKKIETCMHCRQCTAKCPYGLNTPALLEKNYEDYKKVLAGEVTVQ